MKVTAKQLSKGTLVLLIEKFIETYNIDEDFLKSCFLADLKQQVSDMKSRFDELDARLKRINPNSKKGRPLVQRYTRIAELGNKKLAIIKQLEEELDKNASNKS